jgi:hypothetical protein
MNKGSIIVPSILIIVIIALVGIYFWNRQTPSAASDLENIIFSYSIRGCAETDKGMATKGVGNGTEKEPKIEVSENNVTYSRAINHLCCRKVEIQKEIIGSTINIFEVWSGIGCKCICFSEIEATISNFTSGTYCAYTVNVYETGTEPGSDKPMEETLIISKEISFGYC